MKVKKISDSRAEAYVSGKRVVFVKTKNNTVVTSYRESGPYSKKDMAIAFFMAKKILIKKQEINQFFN